MTVTGIPPGALTVWPSGAATQAMTIFGRSVSSAVGGATGSGEMQSAYRLTAGVVGSALEHHDRAQSRALVLVQQDTRPRALVVEGRHDQMQEVLVANRIPHFRIAQEFAAVLPTVLGMDVHGWIAALLVNCSNDFPGAVSSSVAGFVHAGGLLMTSDWALTHLLQGAFPDKVSHNGRSTEPRRYGQSHGAEYREFVEVEAGDTHNPTLLAAFAAAREAGVPVNWWLDPSSHVIRVDDPGAVKVILRSCDLHRRYGSDVIMATFQAGLGLVAHQISHVKLQHAMGTAGAPRAGDIERFTEAFGVGAGAFGGHHADVSAGAAIAAAVSNVAFLSPILRVIGGEKNRGPFVTPA